MKWIVQPSRLSGSIVVPPSKSHTIRALLIAALGNGISTIAHPLTGGDGASAINAARSMGARIEAAGSDLLVTGIAGNYNLGADAFDMGNSGQAPIYSLLLRHWAAGFAELTATVRCGQGLSNRY